MAAGGARRVKVTATTCSGRHVIDPARTCEAGREMPLRRYVPMARYSVQKDRVHVNLAEAVTWVARAEYCGFACR